MDDITKLFIKMLARRQQTLGEMQVVVFKQCLQLSSHCSRVLIGTTKFLEQLRKMPDSPERETLLEELWQTLAPEETHKMFFKDLAKVETAQEHLAADLEALLAKLGPDPTDPS
jgi:hypothetical protein